MNVLVLIDAECRTPNRAEKKAIHWRGSEERTSSLIVDDSKTGKESTGYLKMQEIDQPSGASLQKDGRESTSKESLRSESSGFDMRDIHEHPPPPSQEASSQILEDPAWDASKDVFDEAGDNPMTVLDTRVWADGEEKKEKEVIEASSGLAVSEDWETCGLGFVVDENNDNIEERPPVETTSSEINDTTFSHLSLAKLAEDSGFTDDQNDDELNTIRHGDDQNLLDPQKDDEPLLGLLSSSGDNGAEEAGAVSIEKRLEMYNAIAEDDDSSADSSQVWDDDDESQGEHSEVEYVDQQSDDEGEAEFIASPGSDCHDAQEAELVNDAPFLNVATEAATNAVESQLISNDNTTNTMETKKENTQPTIIPLIPSPPEEKFKKWEENKLRAERHIAATKAGKDVNNSSATAESVSPSNKFSDSITGPPEVTRMHVGNEGTEVFRSPEKKSSGENKFSPSSSSSILADQKMAEKVALASSAAAAKFEEQFRQAGNVEEPDQHFETPDISFLPTNDSLLCGAFSSWESSKPKSDSFEKESDQANLAKMVPNESAIQSHVSTPPTTSAPPRLSQRELIEWFLRNILDTDPSKLSGSQEGMIVGTRRLLDDNANFNLLCEFIADCVNKVTSELGMATSLDGFPVEELVGKSLTGKLGDNVDLIVEKKRPWLKPMVLNEVTWTTVNSTVAAANFVNFLFLASKLSKTPSPFGDSNPFIDVLVTNSLGESEKSEEEQFPNSSPQQMILRHPLGNVEVLIDFIHKLSEASEAQRKVHADINLEKKVNQHDLKGRFKFKSKIEPVTPCMANKSVRKSRLLTVPKGHPSPFEASVWNCPRILAAFLSFLGDPVAVSRMKMVNKFCCRIVSENEHIIMQDAVRTGGLSMNIRPAFWIWITLQKIQDGKQIGQQGLSNEGAMKDLADQGMNGKWHSVIERDVARSFGNMPPHKTGAKLRNDSIVRALVTWGQNRVVKRGVKGGGEPVPTPQLGPREHRRSNKGKPPRSAGGGNISSPPWDCSGEGNIIESDSPMRIDTTVSDWSGVSPVPSFTGSHAESLERTNSRHFSDTGQMLPLDELALGGNCLTNDMKANLQNKLSFILHSLSAEHEEVGYCQGMDYVVAHLLRILQDTVMWKASKGTLPVVIGTAPTVPDVSNTDFRAHQKSYEEVDSSLVVEEVIFRVMDTLFTAYSLRHMYWPELRCLKTFCRVFERLIQIKLPVLADHFEHYDLNVGLFALGWFQTLFLYLPSMPSATVCHMWDIWLVERSFKIFFRVGTAILFLSQPTLLNNELEGMMTYLNTFPDATLLKPDILIPTALNIKVTNRMLQDLEAEVIAISSFVAS
jgi:hypothetical protein